MRAKWLFLIVASVAALTVLVACGGGSDDGGDSNPGGLSETEASALTKQLIEANGCDAPQGSYSSVKVVGDKWELVASLGLKSYTWTLDPVANTVTEASGYCK
jgi:hypothetical protein